MSHQVGQSTTTTIVTITTTTTTTTTTSMTTTTTSLPKSETVRLRRSLIGASCPTFFSSDPLKMVRASGQMMFDEEENSYLDCINNVCHVGHCHPHVVEAGVSQMRLINTNSRFLHDTRVLYAQRLTSTLPDGLDVVYFVNSGSEANDLALRLAHTFTRSREVITLEHAYHGHVLSLIGISPYKYEQPGSFEAKPDTTHVVPVPDVYRGKYRDVDYPDEDLGLKYAETVTQVCHHLRALGKKPSCFIAESLQSCGGQIVYPAGYLGHVYEQVRGCGGVCIADEVQVGLGRVGAPHWWAFELQKVVPDIVTMGKPMGNGHPLAAVVTTRAIADCFAATGVSYFNTFGGNPVSCAIGNAVLDVIQQEHLREHAADVGTHLIQSLTHLQEKHSTIGEVRGVGLFVGIDLVMDGTTRAPNPRLAQSTVVRLRSMGILVQTDGPHNNVIKLKPPLCFQLRDAHTLVQALDKCLSEADNEFID